MARNGLTTCRVARCHGNHRVGRAGRRCAGVGLSGVTLPAAGDTHRPTSTQPAQRKGAHARARTGTHAHAKNAHAHAKACTQKRHARARKGTHAHARRRNTRSFSVTVLESPRGAAQAPAGPCAAAGRHLRPAGAGLRLLAPPWPQARPGKVTRLSPAQWPEAPGSLTGRRERLVSAGLEPGKLGTRSLQEPPCEREKEGRRCGRRRLPTPRAWGALPGPILHGRRHPHSQPARGGRPPRPHDPWERERGRRGPNPRCRSQVGQTCGVWREEEAARG